MRKLLPIAVALLIGIFVYCYLFQWRKTSRDEEAEFRLVQVDASELKGILSTSSMLGSDFKVERVTGEPERSSAEIILSPSRARWLFVIHLQPPAQRLIKERFEFQTIDKDTADEIRRFYPPFLSGDWMEAHGIEKVILNEYHHGTILFNPKTGALFIIAVENG